MKRLIALVSIFASLLCAQDGTATSNSQGPPYVAYSRLMFYDGSSNLIYVCTARSQQPQFAWTRALSTLTSIADSSNTSTVTTSTAHGLAVGNKVTISGATVATALNGTYYIQTVGSTTTFTVTTSGVADATYTESTLSVSTTAPRSTAPVWDISKFIYDGSNLLTNVQHANGASAAGSNSSICDNRATSTGASKIIYQ